MDFIGWIWLIGLLAWIFFIDQIGGWTIYLFWPMLIGWFWWIRWGPHSRYAQNRRAYEQYWRDARKQATENRPKSNIVRDATSEVVRLLTEYEKIVEQWLTWRKSGGPPLAISERMEEIYARANRNFRKAVQSHFDENDPQIADLIHNLRRALLDIRALDVGEENLGSFLAHGMEGVTLGEGLVGLGKPLQVLHEPEPDIPKDISRIIDEEMAKLTLGRALFNPPENMRLGVMERVEVRISRSLTDDLAAGLKGRVVPHTENIKVGTFMKVRLAGATFQIESLSDEEQPVPATGFTQWSWNVKPLESGMHVLSLAIAVRIRLPDGWEKYDSPVLDRKIRVRVNPVYSTVSFVQSNWRWIVTTAVGSGMVWHFLGPKSK